MVIGTGIFFKAASMAQYVGSPVMVLTAWVATGLLALAGALTYAELGAMLPEAGGEYVYLRSAYGDIPAFFLGWMEFIIGPAASAAKGVAFATFLAALLPVSGVWAEHTYHLFGRDIHWQLGSLQVVAVAVILVCVAINCMRVAFSGKVQTILTIMKVTGVLVIIGGVFFYSKTATWDNLVAKSVGPQLSGMKAFGAAMLAALWAYHGWGALPIVAGEVKNPGKNIPRALITGMLIVMIVYVIANLAYFYTLPFEEVVTSNSTLYPDAVPVVTKAVHTFLGPLGIILISVVFMISTFGTLHSSVLAQPRIYFAMARDGLFFSRIGSLSKGACVPVFSIGIYALLACVMATSGTFDQLTTLYMFVACIFSGLVGASVLVLRYKMPGAPRPYRTLGYPVVPLAFVLVSGWLAINTLQTNPIESALGIIVLLLGFPFYYYFQLKSGKRTKN